MNRRFTLCCLAVSWAFSQAVCSNSTLGSAWQDTTDSDKQPVYSSGVVTSASTGHRVKIDVDISGAENLYLVAHDAGDGMSFDWCDWIEPRLVAGNDHLDLAKTKWAYADSGWGSVNVNQNCDGGPLRIGASSFESGIGTHANSVIHFALPKNHAYTRFTAIAGLDRGGIDQDSGSQNASVEFLIFTTRPSSKYWSRNRINPPEIDHDLHSVLSQFDVHPELEVSLFAAEPMLVNPSNIDIDHLGRVWVCEVLNYRGRRGTRPEGDRILILQDTDGDGRADQQTVFYQGPDIDSAHGVCVLGDRALVSAGSQVFYLIDEDGDSRADQKQVLFSGIDGSQHDHGIHAFVFGPDGKLYFNFGNAGRQIKDRQGQPLVDAAGQTVSVANRPYQEGMVFRCNLDGSQFETLAWNFRNNWEVCVDSLGRMWQSDNDDDGNRGVRINYVMPFGNYGYRDEKTGAGWQAERIGMATDIPTRHWHQNDPGVVPNLLQTGAGSPTGICVYEGRALPGIFQNQIVHCDAGPSVVRAYPVQPAGAGFKAEVVNIMDGSRHNQWFRPSDVCVAPDGSLMVADWYDPGVGGHRMGDIQRGRLFRVTRKGSGSAYRIASLDLATPESAAEALASPNQATRFLAWNALAQFGPAGLPALRKLATHDNVRLRMRAVWALSKLYPSASATGATVLAAIQDDQTEVRAAAVRVVSQFALRDQARDWWKQLSANDPSPAVRREMLISLSWRQLYPVDEETRAAQWSRLASQHTGGDRWYLEALGIAADQHWDRCLTTLLSADGVDPLDFPEIAWRSRSSQTASLLAELIRQPDVTPVECKRLLRSFDFLPETQRQPALVDLALSVEPGVNELARLVFVETLSRLPADSLNQSLQAKLDAFLDECTEPDDFVRIVAKFNLPHRLEELVDLAVETPASQLGVDAMAIALDRGGADRVRTRLQTEDEVQFDSLLVVLHRTGKRPAMELLQEYLLDSARALERRKKCVMAMGKIHAGAREIVKWVENDNIDEALRPAVSAALHGARWPEINAAANEFFPLPLSKQKKPLPAMSRLLQMRGDAAHGKLIYENAGTCAKCHVVNEAGTRIGPNLSEIGDKLTRQAMYESILFPSAGISHNYENWTVLTVDGELFSGVIVSETETQLTIVNAEGVSQHISVSDIEEKRQQKLSMMPADLHKELTEQDLADLVEYLIGLTK